MLLTPLLRTIVFHTTFQLIIFTFFILHPIPVYSQEDLPLSPSAEEVLEEELRYLKAETYVITASRIPEDIKKTASSITVVTDREIRQMGAKHLSDVLQTIPGMGFFYGVDGNYAAYARGQVSTSGQKILIMINSHPLNENSTGSAIFHDTMVLDNVKRIEFIRGPGSALYGANAFAGVINVITKEADDIDGWEVTTRGGSYDTQQYNLLYGKTYKDLEIAFNYNYFNTHGYNKHVNEDLLSISNSRASLAPGRMKGDDEKYDVSLNLKYKGITFDGRYVDREQELAIGLLPILNNKSIVPAKYYYLNVSYEKNLWERLDLLGKVYRNHGSGRATVQFLPPGARVRTPWGPYILSQEGILDIITGKNNRTGIETQATYRLTESNTVLAGITYEEIKQYDVRRRGNYLSTPFPNILIPLLRVRDLSSIQNHNKSVKRNFKALFAEDIWDITDNIRLTLGVRYDDYSDFGSEVSPRAGLTWEFIKGYDLKLLYGHAFRAPSFQELYAYGNGNPRLDAETIDTYEVSLGAELTPSFTSRITWFLNWTDDVIQARSSAFKVGYFANGGKIRTEGLEIEMKYDFGRGSYLSTNYTYILSEKRGAIITPRLTANIMANVRLNKYLNFYTSCHVEDGFRRARGDNRDDMSGYAVVNATLIAKKFLKGYEGLELRGSVYNLFDKDYTAPYTQQLPQDIPRPGRNFLVEMKYKF